MIKSSYIAITASLVVLQLIATTNGTCVLNQTCSGRTAGQTIENTPCPDSLDIVNPDIVYFEPQLLYRPELLSGIGGPCPYLNASEPVCCNDDQVVLLTTNFGQLDAVFGHDCPICALNLKRMFCEYTCGPNKTNYVNATGVVFDKDMQVNLTSTIFTVDPDYACTMFHSCAKTSFISQASLQSSQSFLDFMGVNGKTQGKSIINYNFSSDHNSSLITNVYDCGYKVPSNQSIDNYTVPSNCTCTYCDNACEAPRVDGAIGFFDGFDGGLVAGVYFYLIVLTIVFQIVRYYYVNRSTTPKTQINASVLSSSSNVENSKAGKPGRLNDSSVAYSRDVKDSKSAQARLLDQ